MSNETQVKNDVPAQTKEHKLGKLVKCKVHCLSSAEKNHSIFASINEFTFEFQQNTEIMLPIKVVEFLQNSTKPGHKVNDKGFSEAIETPLYAVSVLV